MIHLNNIIIITAITYFFLSALKHRYLIPSWLYTLDFTLTSLSKCKSRDSLSSGIIFLCNFYSNHSGINRRQQNILNIKYQYIYTNVLLFFSSVDQFKNQYLEKNYSKLSLEEVFNMWTCVFVIENIGKNCAEYPYNF